jgi:hypothetical protein
MATAPHKLHTLQPATYTLSEYASLRGASYSATQREAKAGTLPVKPIKVGAKYLFPKALVHAELGLPLDWQPKRDDD